MREFVVSKAPQGRVAALARATVEHAGGIVSQHNERVTEFDNLVPEEGDWSRSGYVGTYQNYGEDPVRVRVRTWAHWPRTLLYWSLFLGFLQAVVFFTLALVGLSPPPNVWILFAVVTFAVIGLALLMYASGWADSAELEDEIARRLKQSIADDEEIPGDTYTLGDWEEHRDELVEHAIAQANKQAPERPSRAKRALEAVKPAGQGAGGLVERWRGRSGGGEQAEASDEGGAEPAGPEPARGDEEEEEEEAGTVLDRVAFWRSEEGDEPGEVASAAGGQEPGGRADEDADAKRRRLEELKRQREEQDAGDEEPPQEQASEQDAEAKRKRLEELKRQREEQDAGDDDGQDEA